MTIRDKSLRAIILFNALTAIVGGIALMAGVLNPPMRLLEHTAFDSYVGPGAMLAIIVGGSSLYAFLILLLGKPYARQVAALAGIIMIGWILGEVLAIREFSWLQVFYLGTGSAVTALAWSEKTTPTEESTMG